MFKRFNFMQFFLLMIVSLINVICVQQATAEPFAPSVNRTVTNFMQQYHVPGVAVLMYVHGKPRTYFFGYASVEKRIPVTANTIFEVGSLSKLMTALLFAERMDYAKMLMTDPVNQYLPTLPPYFSDISLGDLATHTSGLPLNVPNNVTTNLALDSYLASYKSQYEPGQEWVYSNLGIGLLGQAVASETGKSIDKLLENGIAKPLNAPTLMISVPKRYQPFYAQGYDANGNIAQKVSMPLYPGAGACKGSASDMQKFLSASIGLPGTPTDIFYPMRMMQVAYVKLPNRSQGLVWQIYPLDTKGAEAALLNQPEPTVLQAFPVTEIVAQPLYNGNALFDKTGSTSGFRSYIAVLPNQQSGIVILVNKHMGGNQESAIVSLGRQLLFGAV